MQALPLRSRSAARLLPPLLALWLPLLLLLLSQSAVVIWLFLARG